MRVYETGDTGPSGHGQVFRGHVQNMLDKEELDMTVRTHQWGWNKKGFILNRSYPDSRFKNEIMTTGRLNDDYLLEEKRDIAERPDDLIDNLGTNETARSFDCMVRDFEGKEDIWHTVGGMEFAQMAPDDEDTYTIVETDYNLDIVPQVFVDLAKTVDEVWVPNNWVYNAFKNRGYTDNVEIVPYGVDFSYKAGDYDCHSCPANMHTQPPGGGQCLNDDTFTFITVARWYHIKGLDKLIKAYVREFTPEENVRLFIKTTSNNQFQLSGGGVGQGVQQLIGETRIPDPPEIGIRTNVMTDQELMDLYGVADCFAFPSRAECVGISWIQAMRAGTPVVTNDWSAMNEYLTDDEAILIKRGSTEVPESKTNVLPIKGGDWYPDDAHWFDPDIDAIGDAMRRAYEMDQSERDEMTANAKKMVEETFGWEEHAQTRYERFQEVLS